MKKDSEGAVLSSDTYTYDFLEQLLNLSHVLTTDPLNPVTRSSFTYTYDGVGIRETLTTARSNVAVAQTNLSYIYDDLNRLIQATRPLVGDPNDTFQYDPVGNRKIRDGQAFTAVHNSANQLSEDEDFSYTYDLNGDLTRKENKATGEIIDFIWDVQNQLIKIEEKPDAVSAPTQTVEFKYDALGRRIQKDVDGVLIKYIYDGPNILLEYDGANVLQANYTHGPDTDEPLVMNRVGVDYFYQADGLGSITELTDSTGTIVQSYIYDSFGNFNVFDQSGAMISPSGGIANPYTYTGREFDTESELLYYRARYYDSNNGRFLNEDPIERNKGFNLYPYVDNNPINFSDPEGKVKSKPKCPRRTLIYLNISVQISCKAPTKCFPTDSCALINAKIFTKGVCLRSQQELTRRCFPHDRTHKKRIEDTKLGIKRCKEIKKHQPK